jgi:hypothetical protein
MIQQQPMCILRLHHRLFPPLYRLLLPKMNQMKLVPHVLDKESRAKDAQCLRHPV